MKIVNENWETKLQQSKGTRRRRKKNETRKRLMWTSRTHPRHKE
jgi:hypothetical protein